MTTPADPQILTHRIPVPSLLRWGLGAVAVFVIVVPAWELFRGVWPLNVTSPFFLFIILGALSIGIPLLIGVATGPSVLWTVRPGSIRIIQKRPLKRAQHDTFDAASVVTVETQERESMEGDNTWVVVMTVRDGRCFETRSFSTKDAADRFRLRLEDLLAMPPKNSGARTADP
jgi:hypothetical protein